ncbi:MAG: 16S rRNA (guanine(527)-N(7))-methyltransferase RsmG [Oscillospiraceae bacterium]|nr:16S rRNA (guanine(527)-N(7))-methyltransferase RsmG [Oscillospiraceae bacterium]
MIEKNRMETVFARQGIQLSSRQIEQLDRYAQLLAQWNQRMNLTAITDPEGILIKHFLDSILPFSLEPLPESASLIDVGTGAGFPAVPLLIWRPDLQITLLDSLQKRLTFLEEVLAQCELSAKWIHIRAEDGGRQPALREQFDTATARAVANLRELSEYCLPYVRPGGRFYALKGGDVTEETQNAQKAIRLLGGQIEKSLSYSLPDGSGRTLVCIKKISQTSTKFPRNAAKMAKVPLA